MTTTQSTAGAELCHPPPLRYGAAAATAAASASSLQREQGLLSQIDELQRQLDEQREINLDLQATIATVQGEARDSKRELQDDTTKRLNVAKEEVVQAKREAAHFKAALLLLKQKEAEEKEKAAAEEKEKADEQVDSGAAAARSVAAGSDSEWEDEEDTSKKNKRRAPSSSSSSAKKKKRSQEPPGAAASPQKKKPQKGGGKKRLSMGNPVHKMALEIAVEAAIRKKKNKTNSTTEDDPEKDDLPPLPEPPPGAPVIPATTLRRYVRLREERDKAEAAGIVLPQKKQKADQAKRDAVWQDYLKQLIKFRTVFGHTNVPASYPKLGSWVSNQRNAYLHYKAKHPRKKMGMTEDRIKQLEAIGFEWQIADSPVPWEMRFLQLKEYKKKFKHCNVPQFYKDNPKLGIWVKCQRQQIKFKMQGLKRCTITDGQIEKLDAIGFQCNILPPRGSRKKNSAVV